MGVNKLRGKKKVDVTLKGAALNTAWRKFCINEQTNIDSQARAKYKKRRKTKAIAKKSKRLNRKKK